MHRELLAPVPVANWSGSKVIFGGVLPCAAAWLIVITAPHPWELVGLALSNWYIGSIPVPFTFHLVLSSPAVSTIQSPQVLIVCPEDEDVPVGACPISRFSANTLEGLDSNRGISRG